MLITIKKEKKKVVLSFSGDHQIEKKQHILLGIKFFAFWFYKTHIDRVTFHV